MHRHPVARPLITAAALAAAALISACGSSAPTPPAAPTPASSPAGPSASAARSSATTRSTLAFSRCMRASGVPNFPDLTSDRMLIGGDGQTISVNGVSVNAPAFLAARARCRRYLPSVHASAAQTARQRLRALRFARCMRAHGVPNFPDPRVTTGPGGGQEAYLPGIDPQSPAFQSAASACGGGPKGP